MINKLLLLISAFLCIILFINSNLLGSILVFSFISIYVFVDSGSKNKLNETIYLVVLILNALGFLLDFYQIWWFDDVAHTLTPLALVVFLGPFLYQRYLRSSDSTAVKLFTLTALGVTAGAFWEVWEFYAGISVFEELTPTLEDTISDLIFDTIGSVIGGIIVIAKNGK